MSKGKKKAGDTMIDAVTLIQQKIEKGELISREKLEDIMENELEERIAQKEQELERRKHQYKIDAVKKDTFLTDDQFIAKMINWNIPIKYYHVFRDEDCHLGRKELWERVRKVSMQKQP